MRCDEFQAAVLADAETPGTAEHESTCARCRAEVGQLRTMRDVITDPDVWEEPSTDLRNKVVAAIATEADLRRTTPRRSAPWMVAAAILVVALIGIGSFLATRNPPDWEVAIDGTELAPQASGVVAGWNSESGTRMVLDISGLEPAPPGQVYELWLSAGPRHISAGTFVEAGSELELWAGVTRREYPRVWITLEPLDEDPAPSGHTVLDTGA